MMITIGTIILLLALSAFFSGAETALTAASKPYMHRLELNGNHNALLVNRLHDKQGRLIGAILLGNNAVNILASALATSLSIQLYGKAGVFYATAAMTLLILMFAEITPKTYALARANRAALALAPTINIVVMALGPAAAAINATVSGALGLLGIKTGGHDLSDEMGHELRGAIDLHEGEDGAEWEERAMLRSVLDLAEVQVGEIMKHRKDVATIDAGLDADALIQEVLASPYTRLPVWKDTPDNIVGVLHAKALLREILGRNTGPLTTGPKGLDAIALDPVALTAEPWFIPEQTNLLQQLHAFRRRHEHFALVVDEYGALQGIVTLEDILEEIVGDISDEHDIVETGATRKADGSVVVDGSVTIRDLNREFEWRLPDEEAATIAGLVLHEARRIPEVHQSFRFFGFRFEILERRRQQISSIRITPPAGAAAAPAVAPAAAPAAAVDESPGNDG